MRRLSLRGRLLLVYLAGGLLPLLLILAFLTAQQRSSIISLTQRSSESELLMASNTLDEECRVLVDVTKRMYFDSTLEEISQHEFADYAEVVQMYRDYTALDSFEDYYSGDIEGITVYIDNPTLVGNSQLANADEEVKNSEWYQQALADKGQARWWYIESPADGNKYLTLVRMIRTLNGQQVGVAAVRMNLESLRTQIAAHSGTTCLMLGDTVILSNLTQPEFYPSAQQLKELGTSSNLKAQQADINGSSCQVIVSCHYSWAVNSLYLVSAEPFSDILESANDSMRLVLLAVLCCTALSVGIIVWYSTRFGRRVERFKGEMEKASRGERELAPSLGGQDEISDLYQYLNTMIQDIDRLTASIYESRLEQERLQSRQHEVEFKMLASQINPHFLYNTLESIRMKAYASGNREVADMVKLLAKLMRRSIEVQDSPVHLADELTMTEAYLKLQHYRFGETITYEIQAEDDISELYVLPLLLQPLVENAYKHGLRQRSCGGCITVTTKIENQALLLCVIDNGEGMPQDTLAELHAMLADSSVLNQKHIGLANVQQRIRMYYGPEYGLTLESKQGVGTQATLKLPLCRSAEKEGANP